ncbi:glycosyl transferase group 1 [Zunongwangia profunda SM-A87]|uniref:Glycosyl transferase group 1 n=2 Tax=Zunongwangia profunda TaxID=398743 RepID=D5BFG4_ZUNPS|nr:glycosyl transferase group 1 [Zunongwangia profunda SM-A87]
MKNRKVILSHPLGNQNVRAVLRGMEQAGVLGGFVTSVATFPDSSLDKISRRISFLGEFQKRSFDPSLRNYTNTYFYRELGRIICAKLKLKFLTTHESGQFSIDKVCHYIDHKTAQLLSKESGIKGMYAYEDIALESFQVAKSLGISCLYDLPIGYWLAARRLMQQEVEARPEWAPTMVGFRDSAAKLARKDKELALADHIFVASSFTKETLQDYPGTLAPISVVPYGFPPVAINRTYNNPHGKLKLLFVGGLSQRKGLANLFEAVDLIGKQHIELTIVGRKSGGACVPLEKALQEHTYIPGLPHAQILELMQTQDVFVFPSLFEGFGLVITEAMSQGLPVITTERTIGPDIITHAENGWLTEAGNTDSLVAALEHMLQQRSHIPQLGEAAMQKAQSRPWNVYSQETATQVQKLIDN